MKFLTGIALKLRGEATCGGTIARHRLRRKLVLTLRRSDIEGEWVLSLSRDGVPPGEPEEQLCRRAFGVAERAERYADRINGWHIVRLRWKDEAAVAKAEVEQGVLFEAATEPVGNYYRAGG